MLRIPSSQKLTRFLTDENKADPEALRIIEVTAMARISDSLRDLVDESRGTRFQ